MGFPNLTTEQLVAIALTAIDNLEAIMAAVKNDEDAWAKVANRYNKALANFQEKAKEAGKL